VTYPDDCFDYWETDLTIITVSASPARDEQAERLLREPAKYFTEALRRAHEDVRAEIDRRRPARLERSSTPPRPIR
jgi:hypothetical protein